MLARNINPTIMTKIPTTILIDEKLDRITAIPKNTKLIPNNDG